MSNEAYLQELVARTRDATDKSMRKAMIFVQGEAQKLASDRIYKNPVRGNYVRTGLYKSSIKAYVKKTGGKEVEGILESPVVYAKHLEYKCQYMCLTDAVLNNRDKIKSILKENIGKVSTW